MLNKPTKSAHFKDSAPARSLRRALGRKDSGAYSRRIKNDAIKLARERESAIRDTTALLAGVTNRNDDQLILPSSSDDEISLITASTKRMIENQKNADPRDLRIATIADALFSKGAKHEASFSNIGFVPLGNPAIPEVAFAGRSRCGISSILRSLFKSRGAVQLGNSKARRDVMNCYSVGGGFHVLETPGFGAKTVPWAVVLQYCSLLRTLCAARPNLKMLYYVMDVSETFGLSYRDVDTIKFLQEEVKNFTIVISKSDKIRDIGSVFEQLQFHGIEHPTLTTSAWTLGGIDALRFDMVSSALHSLPTERLTMGEVRRLSERLYSAGQIASGAAGGPRLPIHRPVSVIDEEHARWRAKVMLANTAEEEFAAAAASAKEPPQLLLLQEGKSDVKKPQQEQEQQQRQEISETENVASFSSSALTLSKPQDVEDQIQVSQETVGALLQNSLQNNFNVLARAPSEKSIQKFLRPHSQQYLAYVAKTSPWRNPHLYPAHVAVTFNKRVNVVKCPEDPDNPWLFQAKFAVPRADWNFRRPSLKFRKRYVIGKGTYQSDAPQYFFQKYTIPFFPDITDVRMIPQPVAFVGASAYYDRGSRGKQFALKKHARALEPITNVTRSDLVDQPAVAGLLGAAGKKTLAEALKSLDASRRDNNESSSAAAAMKLRLEEAKERIKQLAASREKLASHGAESDQENAENENMKSEEETQRKEVNAMFSHPTF